MLLVVEIHVRPTPCEPLTLGWNLTKLFEHEGFAVEMERHVETKGKYCSVKGTFSARPLNRTAASKSGCPRFDHTNPEQRDGFLVARMRKMKKASGEALGGLAGKDPRSTFELRGRGDRRSSAEETALGVGPDVGSAAVGRGRKCEQGYWNQQMPKGPGQRAHYAEIYTDFFD